MHSDGEDGWEHSSVNAIITKPSQLGPIRHPTNENLYRVVLWRYRSDPEYDYAMCVGDGYVRMYSEDTLPIDLRVRLTAIDSFIEGLISRGVQSDPRIHTRGSQTAVYENSVSPELDDIGWVHDDDIYCLVMSENELSTYKGES